VYVTSLNNIYLVISLELS